MNFRCRDMIIACLLTAMACSDATKLPPIDAGSVPDWQLAAPARVGLDAEKLALAQAYAFRPEFYTQSVAIVKDGYLVAEWYAEGVDARTMATSWSVGKSFVSTLIGMSLDRGEIAGLDESVATFVPAWLNTPYADITLHDVLTMSSGLHWIEDYETIGAGDDGSDVIRLVLEADPLAVVFEQPITAAPGESWVYSSGDSMLLGHILKVATGKNATALATERLAIPLGMTAFEWWQDGTGSTYTFCCVDTTSRDFAKFGQLFLQRGVWGGRQIVSEAWVAQATSPQAAGNRGYGFQWWLNHPEATSDVWPSLPHDAYFALGHNGQYVAVFPSANMVVVRNGEYLAPEYPAIAPDGLFAAGLWSDDLAPTGTRGPEGDWDQEQFFGLILAAVD